MKVTWRTEAPQLAIIAGMFIAAILTWPHTPEQIPVHWDMAGQPTRYGGKFEGLLVLPLTALGLYVLMLLAPRIDPGRANYARFAKTYHIVRISILAPIAVIYTAVQMQMHGYAVEIETIVPVAVGGLFIILGNFMGKIRPNWFVGIRTPWTLSSKRSWVKTHRLGGWLLMVMGAAFIAFPFVGPPWLALALLFGVLFAGLGWMIIYSYLVYRNDPERIAPSGTEPGDGMS